MHVSKRVAVWCAVVSAAAVVLAGCVTGAPPGTGTTGPDDISITFGPSGTDGPCVQVPTTTVPGPPTTVPPTYLPQNPIYNNPNYFTGPTNGICTKLEPVATPFVMPVPEFGNVWTLLVIKAGSGTQANQLVAAPAVGQSYTHTSGQDISHVIFCQRPFSED